MFRHGQRDREVAIGEVWPDSEGEDREEPGQCLHHGQAEVVQVLSPNPGQDLHRYPGEVETPPDLHPQGAVQGGQAAQSGPPHRPHLYPGMDGGIEF